MIQTVKSSRFSSVMTHSPPAEPARKITEEEEGDILQLQMSPSFCPVCRKKRKKIRCRPMGPDMVYCPSCKGRYPVQPGLFRKELIDRVFSRYKTLLAILAHLWMKRGHGTLGDLTSKGFFGLLNAVEHWNPDKGKATFQTFATYWINQAMTAPEEGSTPVKPQAPHCPSCSKGKRRGRVKCHLIDPMTAYCPCCGETFRLGVTPRIIVSLEEPEGREEGRPVTLEGLFASEEPGPDQLCEISENRATVQRALSLLDPRHREVIECRFFKGLSLEETGRAMGNLTKERIRQLQEAALKTLRASLTGDVDPNSELPGGAVKVSEAA